MGAVEKLKLISAADYLTGELVSPIKHESLGGIVDAMAVESNLHNQIATNVTVALGVALRGKPGRPYNSDTKIHIQLSPAHERFYYPDASVICDANPDDDSFQDQPVVIVEVLSQSTRRIDEGEKRDAYLTIPSLRAYVLVEPEQAAVVVYRRSGQGFNGEIYSGLMSVVPLPEVGIELPLAEIYDRVEFRPEVSVG